MSDISIIQDYLNQIRKYAQGGKATEHTYRVPFGNLLKDILRDDIQAVNEPKRVKCGAPDYVLTKKDIPMQEIDGGKV